MKGVAGVLVLVIAAAILNSCRAEKQDLDSVYDGDHEEKQNYHKQRRGLATSIVTPILTVPAGVFEVLKRNLDKLGGPNLVRRSLKDFQDHDGLEKYTYGQKEDKHVSGSRVVRELRDFRRSNGWMTPYILARQLSNEMQQLQSINSPKRSIGDGNFDEIDLSGLDTFNHNAKRTSLYGASGNYICRPIDY